MSLGEAADHRATDSCFEDGESAWVIFDDAEDALGSVIEPVTEAVSLTLVPFVAHSQIAFGERRESEASQSPLNSVMTTRQS